MRYIKLYGIISIENMAQNKLQTKNQISKTTTAPTVPTGNFSTRAVLSAQIQTILEMYSSVYAVTVSYLSQKMVDRFRLLFSEHLTSVARRSKSFEFGERRLQQAGPRLDGGTKTAQLGRVQFALTGNLTDGVVGGLKLSLQRHQLD